MPINLEQAHKIYIAHTSHKASVADNAFYLGDLPDYVFDLLDGESKTLFITTKSLKHLYDKRTAREYDFILEHLSQMMLNPDLLIIDHKHPKTTGLVAYI